MPLSGWKSPEICHYTKTKWVNNELHFLALPFYSCFRNMASPMLCFWTILLTSLIVGAQSCDTHDECTGSDEFCYCGDCASCAECHYCSDGVDGTCGSCGSGYPLYESSCDGSSVCGGVSDLGYETLFYIVGGLCVSLFVLRWFWKKRQREGQEANQVEAQVVTMTAATTTQPNPQSEGQGQSEMPAMRMMVQPVTTQPVVYAVGATATNTNVQYQTAVVSSAIGGATAVSADPNEVPPSYDEVNTSDAPPPYTGV